VFTFKPRKAWEKVEHHNVVPGNVKAKFVLTKKNQVPPTALSGGGTAAVQQPVQVSDYELARGQRMKDNNDVMLSLGLIDLAKQISIEHEPVKRAKTSKKGKSSEPGPRRASRRLAVCDSEHDGELPDCQATRTKNDEGGEDDEDDEDEEDEEDDEDEDEEED
jgi:hypothetical protein